MARCVACNYCHTTVEWVLEAERRRYVYLDPDTGLYYCSTCRSQWQQTAAELETDATIQEEEEE